MLSAETNRVFLGGFFGERERCNNSVNTCHRAVAAASAGWWNWGRSGCELRLCGGS